MIQISAIARENVAAVADACLPHLDKAAKYSGGRFEGIDLLALCASGEKLLWVVFEEEGILGVIVTSITYYPRLKAMSWEVVGGTRMVEWYDQAAETLTKAARDLGCSKIETITMRPAWDKWHGKHSGMTKEFWMFSKDV